MQLPAPRVDPVQGLNTPLIAVLPFEDRTGEAFIDHLVRVSFYSHLSARPFRDIELPVVDARLQPARGEPHGILSPVAQGRLAGADLAVSGEILDFRRFYAGIYARMSIEVLIEVWHVRSGRKIWTDRRRVDSHEGGVPLNPLEIPLIGIKSGYHLRDRNKIRLVDELARYLTARLPMTIDPRGGGPLGRFELQIYAFSEPHHAAETVQRMRGEGYPAYLQSIEIGGRRWHRVLLGPYESRPKAEAVHRGLPADLAAHAFVRALADPAENGLAAD
ncbi:MAG: SPOR domain-containing protein [Desulfobacterales bacterium]